MKKSLCFLCMFFVISFFSCSGKNTEEPISDNNIDETVTVEENSDINKEEQSLDENSEEQDKIDSDVIAIVEGEYISSKDIDGKLKHMPVKEKESYADIKTLKKHFLDEAINDIILKNEAENQNIVVSQKELEEEVNNFKKTFPNEKSFLLDIKEKGFNMETFRNATEENLIIEKLVEKESKNGDYEKWLDELKKEKSIKIVEPNCTNWLEN